jgi:DHA2 family methylenomycin A resistance protein-like MFS transporter
MSGRNKGSSGSRGGVALVAICVAYFMVILDTTVVNVALPSLERSLHTTTTALEWVVDGYSLVFAALLLTGGALSDRRGARGVFQAGVACFTAASAACGLAPSVGLLIAARCAQGFGATLAVPASLALIQAAFPGVAERRRAFGIWGAVAGIAAGGGPVLGGALVAGLGWRAVFFANVPIGLAGIAFGARHLPRPDPRSHGTDPAGQVAGVVVLGSLTAALVEAGALGWSSLLVLSCLVVFAVSGMAFIAIEWRSTSPMLPLGLFASTQFSGAVGVGGLINLGFYGELFVLTLYLQAQRHLSALVAGVALLPQMAMATVGSTVAGRAAARYGPRPVMLTGLTLGAGGLAGLAITTAAHQPYAALVAPLVATGVGMALTMPAATAAAMEAAPSERAGLASGTLNAARQAGGVIGVALLGTLVAASTDVAAALQLAMAIAAAAFAVGALLAVTVRAGRAVPAGAGHGRRVPSRFGVTTAGVPASSPRDESRTDIEEVPMGEQPQVEAVPVGAQPQVEVVVIGAGLAGLAAAVAAARRGASVAVCDVGTAGGRARSDQRDGYTFNRGPHALYRRGAGAEVLARLGVDLGGSPPYPTAAGYTAASDELVLLPTAPGSLLRSPLLGMADMARFARLLTAVPRLAPASLAERSAAQWIASSRLTPRGRTVLASLTRVATYAGDLDLLAADAAVGQLRLARRGVLYLDGGWQSLVDGLLTAAAPHGVRVLEGERVTDLCRRTDGTFAVRTPARTLETSSVVVAAGGPAAARALLPDAPRWALGAPATAACLDLGSRRVPTTPVAYGLDQPLYLSTHAPRARLAPPGRAVVHVMRYGARTATDDRTQLWALARRCGIDDADVVTQRFLHEMTVCHALPRPGAGLAGRPAVDATGIASVFLAGDWVGGIGLLADAALASGEAAGHAAAAAARRRRALGGAKVGR